MCATRPRRRCIVLTRTTGWKMHCRCWIADRNAWPVMDGRRLAGIITLAQVEHEMAEGHGDRRSASYFRLPTFRTVADVAKTFRTCTWIIRSTWRCVAWRDSKLNVLPVVGRADIRDLKGVVSLKDILQAYGVAGEEAAAAAASEETGPPRRLVPGVIAAALAVLLVIGFLNYYYRSERGVRAEEYYKSATALLQQDRDDEAVQQFRDALSVSPGNARYRLALGLALVKMNRHGRSRGLPP